MTVFKTFWKTLNKNKFVIILYTAFLLLFGISNMRASEQSMSFSAEKPNILIINHDEESTIAKNLVEYLNKSCKVKDLEKEEIINDALFYREVDYIIEIPENYGKDFLEGKDPEVKVKTNESYYASYSEMILTRYMQVANIYQKNITDETELVNKINEVLEDTVDINMMSKLNTTALQKATYYYNFASYSLLACLVFIIGLIINSFNEEKIRKRIIISSIDYKKHNRILLLSNCCYAFIVWLFYVIISLFILKETMFTMAGLIYIINSFVFTIAVTALSFLVANLVGNKDALSGISNVISLGSSFLCGAFVPMRWLPDFVVKIAHILPTYYYISNNESLTTLENINFETTKPIITNMLIMIGFTIIFIVLSNVVAKKKRKIG